MTRELSTEEQMMLALRQELGLEPRNTTLHTGLTGRDYEVFIDEKRYMYLHEGISASTELPMSYRLILCVIDESLPDELSDEQRERFQQQLSETFGIGVSETWAETGKAISREELDFDDPDWSKNMFTDQKCLWLEARFRPAEIDVVQPHIQRFFEFGKEFSLELQ